MESDKASKIITLELSVGVVQVILNALMERPYKEASAIIAEVMRQANEQLQETPPATSAPVDVTT